MCLPKKKKGKQDGKVEKDRSVQESVWPSIWTPDNVFMGKWANDVWDKGVDGLKEEFRTVEKWAPEDATFNAAEANTSSHKCQDRGRVSMDHTNGAYPYYNANVVRIDVGRREVICASQPTNETAAAFWAMLVKYDHEIYAFDDCFCPTSENPIMTFGQPPNAIKVTYKGKYKGIGHTVPGQGTKVIIESPFGPPKKVVVRDCDSFDTADWHWNDEDHHEVLFVSKDGGDSSLFLAYQCVLRSFRKKKNPVPIPEIVKELRRQRFGMILNEDQYLFLHNEIIRNIMAFQSEASNKNYVQWLTEYEVYKLEREKPKEPWFWKDESSPKWRWVNQELNKGVAGLRAEFKTMALSDAGATFTAAAASNDTSPHKCQDQGRIPMDHTNGVFPYYNANKVQVGKDSREFIVASQPTKDTAAAFWAMLIKCDYEVYAFNNCFCPNKENEIATFGQAPNLIKVTYKKDNVDAESNRDGTDYVECCAVDVTIESPFGPPKNVVVRNCVDMPAAYFYTKTLSSVKQPFLIVANDIGYSSMFPAYEYFLKEVDEKKAPMSLVELVKDLRRQRSGSIGTEAYLYLASEFIDKCMYGACGCSNENWVKWQKEYDGYEPKFDPKACKDAR